MIINNKNESNPIHPNPKVRKNKNFYIALIICMTVMAAAAWSTYESVKDFVSPPSSNSQDSLTHQEIGKSVSKTEKGIRPDSSKNEILDKDNNENTDHRNRKLIPYDAEKKTAENSKAHRSAGFAQVLQSVSAQPTNSLSVYPVSSNVTKEFSDGKPVYSPTLLDWRVHDGADFKAEAGETVKAITDGIVKDIYSDSSYGTTVVIEHNPKFVAYYSGLSNNVSVEKGKKIKTGDQIGTVEKVPCESSEESHLHLMINKDGKFIDPLLILEEETR